MKRVTLAISALTAFALSAGMAVADMQPIPNPPERHHMTMRHHHHHVIVHHHHHK
jgi:Spy/CpxP family protein refolding chaperone